MNQKQTPMAKTKADFYKIVKELEILHKQGLALIPSVKIQIHKDMNLEQFRDYIKNSAAEIFNSEDPNIVHMFLYWMIEVDKIPSSDFSEILFNNLKKVKECVNKNSLNSRFLSNPFSKLSSLEKRSEYRLKYLNYLKFFCEDPNQIQCLYVDKEDSLYNHSQLEYLLSKKAFNKKASPVIKRYILDLNNKDQEVLLKFLKYDADLESFVIEMVRNDLISLGVKIDDYLTNKLIQSNPILKHEGANFKDGVDRFKNLTEQLNSEDTPRDLFDVHSLNHFFVKNYGFKGQTLSQSFKKYLQKSFAINVSYHTVAGNVLRDLFASYENKGEYKSPYSNYILEILSNNVCIAEVVKNKKNINNLTSILSPSQLFKIIKSIHSDNFKLFRSVLNSLDKILSYGPNVKEHSLEFIKQKSFFEYNTLRKLNDLLAREAEECELIHDNLTKKTDFLFDNKERTVSFDNEYSLEIIKNSFELAKLRKHFKISLIKKYQDNWTDYAFFILKKSKKEHCLIVTGKADEKTILFNDYVAKNRPKLEDYENSKAMIEVDDAIILDCISFEENELKNSVLNLPNNVFKNICVELSLIDLISEKYFFLNIVANTMTKDYVFDLKERQIVESTPLEILSWQLEKVFSKEVEDKTVAPEIVEFSYIDSDVTSVLNLLNSNKNFINSLALEHKGAEEFVRLCISYICDLNLPLDTDLKQISQDMWKQRETLLKRVLELTEESNKTYTDLMVECKSHMMLAEILLDLRSREIICFDGDVYFHPNNIKSSIFQAFESKQASSLTWDDLKHIYPIDKEVLKQIVNHFCEYKMKKVGRNWVPVFLFPTKNLTSLEIMKYQDVKWCAI